MEDIVNIENIGNFPPEEISQLNKNQDKVKNPTTFKELMGNFVEQSNELQKSAELEIEKFIRDEETDIHKVVIAVEEANISFQLVMQMRNKLLEAFQELMKTQI